MKSNWRVVVCASIALAGLAACGTDEKSIPLEDLQARRLDVVCRSYVACGIAPDRPTCVAIVGSDSQPIVEVRAGRSKYDPTAAAACLAFLDSPDGLDNCSYLKRSNLKIPSACEATFAGTLADGASCLADESCVSRQCDRSSCSGANACCTGKCASSSSLQPVAVGGACDEGQPCIEGTSCRFDAVSGSTCQPRSQVGEGCQSVADCVATATCLRKGDGMPGICAMPVAPGQACVQAEHPCDLFTNFCDPATLTCVPKAAVGGPCVTDDGCPAFARCDTATSTCQTQANVGEACGQVSGDCIEGLDCTDGKCAAATIAPICE